jgi:quinol monooxygenase YgiN
MVHVIVATWVAKPGEADHIEEQLAAIAPEVRAEEKTLAYLPQRSTENPDEFVMYERYTDPSGFEEHCSSDLFRRVVTEDLAPRLLSEDVRTYTSFAD